ncbi:hypothetical protein Ancab_012593 [Ancistrocladus abbreviatus]
METVAAAGASEQGNLESNAADKFGSSLASLKQGADPIVYKLVRVDFDGRLIPATDDELMEVEDLLEYEKGEMLSVSDVVEAVECKSNGDVLSEKPLSDRCGGLMQSEKAGVAAENLNARLEETLPFSAPSLKGKQENQSGCSAKCTNLGEEVPENQSSNSIVITGSKPSFSKLKGEINLDKYTIRELQETFRATFGRETSVKDKQWLKRRIAMGLTNSCNVSVTSFIIKDKKLVIKDSEESCKKVDAENSVAETVSDDGNRLPVSYENEMKGTKIGGNLGDSSAERDCKSDDPNEQKVAKRVRKPTRRYIEELSDMDTRDYCERLISPAKRLGQSKSCSQSTASHAPVRSNVVIMRHDSLGGSGVRVPFVSRVRRCRPRKSIISLTRFQTSGIGMATKWDENPIQGCDSQLEKQSGDKIVEVRSAPSEDPAVGEVKKEQQLTTSVPEVCVDEEPKHVVSSGNNSDDNAATVATAKGGFRRKHHRAWTLSEVVKLVEGVSRFGAGRWSEIKRLSFASYSYRTSVDLKDKWRNLLKASFANVPPEKGVNARKNTTMPIPAAILLKVRELAELNGQLPKNFKVSSGQSGASVNENRSGFL